MGIITFSSNSELDWYVAGWAFRQILDDVVRSFPDDAEIADEFEAAKLYKSLMLELLEPLVAARIKRHIASCRGILAGTVESGIGEQPYGDAQTRAQYFGALKELLRVVELSTRQSDSN